MTDIQMMKDQLNGLIEKGKALREKERVHLKLQGINEEIEKTGQEREQYRQDLEEAKGKRDELVKKKNDAVAETAEKIASKMDEILPVGQAVFDMTDGLVIGWADGEGKTTPYNGLSGGEKQMFDSALAHVLDANIIVLEAAELDDDHLLASLEDLAKTEKQVIVNTCHPIDTVPEPFVRVEVGG